MFELKPLSVEAVPAALEKARHYRLLNEPAQAESICRDILRVEKEHHDATVLLVLSLSDRFGEGLTRRVDKATELAKGFEDDYEREYYLGLIAERRARFHLTHGRPGCHEIAYDWYRNAMGHYEKADELAPEGNDDAILRWNTCARTLNRHPELRVDDEDLGPLHLE